MAQVTIEIFQDIYCQSPAITRYSSSAGRLPKFLQDKLPPFRDDQVSFSSRQVANIKRCMKAMLKLCMTAAKIQIREIKIYKINHLKPTIRV